MQLRNAILASTLLAAGAAAAHAAEPRTIDFQSGIVVDAPVHEGIDSLPGVGLQVRWFASRALWLSGGVSGEGGADLRNPEQGRLVSLLAGGVAGGLYRDLGARLTVYAGARADLLHAWDWPDGLRSHGADGVRGGPVASVALMVGHAWGHPMSLEARASWLFYRVGGENLNGWQAGVWFTGVLFPDR